ncbi:hypothetical protein QCD75_20700 [Arthrobacter sp. PsM3]|nr:hypothetical protein [Arthrobacter sp. PsM3]MDN4646380.1 hypothetical protein [Arthrobacter sp. PsM3]
MVAVQRELYEEIGTPAPQADFVQLGSFRQPSGKVFTVFAAESVFEPERSETGQCRVPDQEGTGHSCRWPSIRTE